MGEIAGPNGCPTVAGADINGEIYLLALHMLGHRRLIITIHHGTGFRHRHAAYNDRQPIAVRGLSGFANGGNDAPPVSVLRENGGLDQRRVSYRKRNALGCTVILGA